jgi:hypothetical protein
MAMTPSEMIEVLQHFVDGGMIEFRSTIDDDYLIWQDAVAPAWNFDDFDYRIKPKPLELWVIVTARGVVLNTAFTDILTAHACLKSSDRVVHMREVMGD